MDELPVVLVVEDEEPLRDVIYDALKEGGFDVMTVGSRDEAVTMLKSGVVKYKALAGAG
jgi:CheY-like chemotaxis protein